MDKTTLAVLLAGLVLGLSSTAVAQPQQQQQNQTQAFQVDGECVVQPNMMNQTDAETPFMTCQYTRSQDSAQGAQSLMDQMMQRMGELMSSNQSMGGQGTNGQGQGMGGQ